MVQGLEGNSEKFDYVEQRRVRKRVAGETLGPSHKQGKAIDDIKVRRGRMED